MDNTIVSRKTITILDIASHFQVSLRTVKNWIQQRKIPQPLPFSRKLRWEAESFWRWVEQQETAQNAG